MSQPSATPKTSLQPTWRPHLRQANPPNRRRLRWLALGSAVALAAMAPASRASVAYGSINNFDVVNDTGHECHGFEIELEDLQTTDITYTFDWNHYSKSRIFSGTTAGGKPATFVRWESARNPNGSWAAFTAIPSGPIAPTDGHQFTDPSVNFGGEHFGTGYTVNPTAVRYYWLYDDGTGQLVRGAEVQISTPVFNYAPPAGNVGAQVQAVIQPPAPPVQPAKEFGDPMWVKEIRTTTHNANKIKLRDLVSDDPADPNDKNWRNGEPDEIEVEWQLMQVDFNKANGGANGELAAAPEELGDNNEVVTRRYEFFKYVGPIDNESGEAMADSVAADNVHGKGAKTINGVAVDLATVEIVGDYIGAQMAAFDAQGGLGLIDNVPDADLNVDYPARTVIIGGQLPFTATTQGELPAGLNFDPVSGVLSGMPTEPGSFTFSVTANDGANSKTQTYTFSVAGDGVQPPLEYVIGTGASPAAGGLTTGDGNYVSGCQVTVNAITNAGYRFVNWTDNGVPVSTNPSFSFAANVNRALTANFVAVYNIATSAAPANLGSTTGDGAYDGGGNVTVTATANAGAQFVNWTEGGTEVSTAASYSFTATGSRALVANFVPATVNIAASASPADAGSVSGTGAANVGATATLIATANAGFSFLGWTENGSTVSNSATYSFTATANRTLVAEFAATVVIGTTSAPSNGGSTSGGGSFSSGSAVTVTANPAAGFSFVSWLEGSNVVSTSASYTFTATASRTLTATFQTATSTTFTGGTFQGIVGSLVGATIDTSGVMTLTTVAGTRMVSGSVQLGENKVSFRTAVDSAGHALVALRSKVATSVDLQFDATSGFSGTVVTPKGNAPFAARPCPYTAKNPLDQWAGDYTHIVGFPRLHRAPLPVGVGTHTITPRGVVRLAGKLSDGTSYSVSSLVTDVNHFALYDATRLGRVGGFLLGEVALADTGSITSGSPVTWKPANATAAGRFQFYFDTFTKPGRNEALLQVDPGVRNLDVLATNPIGGLLAGWQLILRPNGTTTDLRTGPGAITLRADNTDGSFDGRFLDGATTRSFTGVVWQSSGGGFGIIPGYGDAVTLSLQAIGPAQ